MNKLCKKCEKELSRNTKGDYCIKCIAEVRKEEKIKVWQSTGNTGCKTSTTIRGAIREYLYKKQNYRCSICDGENKWNGLPLHFILDHINGDASNSSEENIRLICPNCDSQLDTYKSKNKGSARNYRRKDKSESHGNT